MLDIPPATPGALEMLAALPPRTLCALYLAGQAVAREGFPLPAAGVQSLADGAVVLADALLRELGRPSPEDDTLLVLRAVLAGRTYWCEGELYLRPPPSDPDVLAGRRHLPLDADSRRPLLTDGLRHELLRREELARLRAGPSQARPVTAIDPPDAAPPGADGTPF